MDGRHFDKITQSLTAGASRRQAFGGLLGGALALVAGASVLEAKKGGNGKGRGNGGGKGRGKGNNKNKDKDKGKGRRKVTLCHANDEGGYNLITVGAPAVKAHVKNHGDVVCEPGVCQTGATGCADDGACEFALADVGTVCVAAGDVAGTCNAEGACVPDPVVEE